MTIARSRRITFEEVADLYAEVRPGYPEALVEDMLGLSAFPAGGRGQLPRLPRGRDP